MIRGTPTITRYSNATKRQLDFHRGGDVGEPSAPLANFFGPRRKKPTNFNFFFTGGVLENRVGAPVDDANANVSQVGYHNAESKITHDVGYSLESRGRKKRTNKTTRKRVTQRCGTPNLSPNLDGGELLSSHSTEGLAANDNDPSLQT